MSTLYALMHQECTPPYSLEANVLDVSAVFQINSSCALSQVSTH